MINKNFKLKTYKMKKTSLFAFIGLALVFNSCKKEEPTGTASISNVSTEQKVLVMNITGTWCGNCSGRGIPNFEQQFTDHPNKVCGIGVHFDNNGQAPLDPFPATKVNSTIQSSYFGFGSLGFPAFVVGTNPLKDGPALDVIESSVEATLALTPACGIGVSKTISGTVMTINTKTIFLRDMPAAMYNIVIYVTEDNLSAEQIGIGFINHQHVLRGIVKDVYTGINLTKAAVAKNAQFDGNYTFTLDSKWKAADLHVIAAVYEVKSSKPVAFLNCNSDKNY